jgi:hypothetical protein
MACGRQTPPVRAVDQLPIGHLVLRGQRRRDLQPMIAAQSAFQDMRANSNVSKDDDAQAPVVYLLCIVDGNEA